MDNWTNTCVIQCVDHSGEKLSVIEQSRADRVDRTLHMASPDSAMRRYVLGNGTKVKPLDVDRFLLLDTKEIVTRL